MPSLRTDYDSFQHPDGDLIDAVCLQLKEAIVEREKLQKIGTDFILTEDLEAYSGYQHQWIRQLYGRIQAVAGQAVRLYNDDGSDYVIEGKQSIDSLLFTRTDPFDSGTRVALTFPYPNGWKRKVQRDIYTLSQPGTNGQRARFTARGTDLGGGFYTPTPFYACLTSDVLFGTGVITPLLERPLTGQYYEHDGTEWVLATDQSSQPDTIEEYITGLASHTWLPKNGDLLDWTNLNDLGLALKQCVKFMGDSDYNTTDCDSPALQRISDFEYKKLNVFGNPYYDELVGATPKYTETDAIADWTDETLAVGITGSITHTSDSGLTDLYATYGHIIGGYFHGQSIAPDGNGRFDGSFFKAKLFVSGTGGSESTLTALKQIYIAGRPETLGAGDPAETVYEDYSLTTILNTYTQYGSDVTEPINAPSVWIGEIEPVDPAWPVGNRYDHPFPGFPDIGDLAYPMTKGYATVVTIVCDFRVEGGFKWT